MIIQLFFIKKIYLVKTCVEIIVMNEKNIFEESIDLQIQAKKIGLDWLEIDGIISKLKEETKEVEQAIIGKDQESIKEELGDLFFTFLCLTRHLKIDPNQVLMSANLKFKKRFEKVKSLLEKDGKCFANPEEMEKLWQLIKKAD